MKDKMVIKKALQKLGLIKKPSKLRGKALYRAIAEAQKDPGYMREVRKFIKITTS